MHNILFLLSLLLGSLFLEAFTEYQFINWSLAIGKDSTKKERQVMYLGYGKYLNVYCDLLDEVCDVNCCSDKDCSHEQILSFSCPRIEEKSDICISGLPQSSIFHCVFMNSPYIGEFFESKRKIEKVDAFKLEIAKQQNAYLISQQINIKSSPEIMEKYKYGQPLKTILINSLAGSNSPSQLKLPKNVLSFSRGYCANAPVMYLIDQDSSCNLIVSEDSCVSSNSLRLATYMVFDDTRNLSEIYGIPSVLSDSSGSNLTPSVTKYFCLKKYSHYSILYGDYQKISFGEKSYEFLEECEEDLEEIIVTHYDEQNRICHNVLVELFLNFLWNGTQLLKMEAMYILANVPTVLASPENEVVHKVFSQHCSSDENKENREECNETFVLINQKFHVTFNHNSRRSLPTIKNGTVVEESILLMRSGQHGYYFNTPVFIIDFAKDTNKSTLFEENVISLWKSGRLGECVGGQPAPFGFDSHAGCRILLSSDDFLDCEALRERVKLMQESLLPGSWLASSGERANYSERQDLLVPILRSDNVEASPAPPSSPTPPSNISSESEDDVGAEQDEEDEGFPPEVTCSVPAAWRLVVLYDATPHAHVIVGARLTWENREWISPKQEAAPFQLWSSVQFSRVLPPSPRLSRFWEFMYSVEGSGWGWINAFTPMQTSLTLEDVFDMFLVLTIAALTFLAWIARHRAV